MLNLTRLRVPLSTFVLAIALSYLTGSSSKGITLRPVQDATGPGCDLSIDVVHCVLSAINWCHVAKGAGKLLCTAHYDGRVNTTERRVKETLALKLHVHIMEEDFIPNPQSWSGKQMVPIKSVAKTLPGSADSPLTVDYGLEFASLEPNDGADLDAAIAKAAQNLADALAQAGEQIGPTHAVKTDKTREDAGKGFDAHLTITTEGELNDGRPCFARAVREAKINLDKDGFVINKPLEPPKKDKN